jgi:hypothetical protein
MYKTSSPYSLRLRRPLVYPEARKIVTRESLTAWRVARTLTLPGGAQNSLVEKAQEVTITKEDSGLVGDDQPTFLCAAA